MPLYAEVCVAFALPIALPEGFDERALSAMMTNLGAYEPTVSFSIRDYQTRRPVRTSGGNQVPVPPKGPSSWQMRRHAAREAAGWKGVNQTLGHGRTLVPTGQGLRRWPQGP